MRRGTRDLGSGRYSSIDLPAAVDRFGRVQADSGGSAVWVGFEVPFFGGGLRGG